MNISEYIKFQAENNVDEKIQSLFIKLDEKFNYVYKPVTKTEKKSNLSTKEIIQNIIDKCQDNKNKVSFIERKVRIDYGNGKAKLGLIKKDSLNIKTIDGELKYLMNENSKINYYTDDIDLFFKRDNSRLVYKITCSNYKEHLENIRFINSHSLSNTVFCY